MRLLRLGLIALATLLAAGATVPAAPAAAQAGDPELATVVEQLSGRVGVLERRVKRTRRALRRSQARIKKLERSLAEGERPGSDARRLTSPDRRFSVVAANDGLQLRGPDSFIGLGPDTITLNSRNDTLLQLAPGSAGLRAPTGVLDFRVRGTLTAPLVFLGGQTGCLPAGRPETRCAPAGRAGSGRSRAAAPG
jgi:hypothetical protein